MRRIVFVVAAAAALGACTPEPPAASSATAPQPAAASQADVPAQYAAFAGHWRGSWDGAYPAELVVERIAPDGQLTLSYKFGQDAPVRIRSRIENNGFAWGTTGRFTFTLRPDGRLAGERVTPSGQLNLITMSRRS
jgi:hypothetical protein